VAPNAQGRPHVHRGGELAILLYGEIEFEDAFGTFDTYRFGWIYARHPAGAVWGKPVGDEDDQVWEREWEVVVGPRSYFAKRPKA
jgi:hypothetical protein